MRNHNLTLKIFSLIIVADLLEGLADLCIKKGINDMGFSEIVFSQLALFLSKSCVNYFIWAGIFLYILNFFTQFAVLSRIELSIANPVGSTSYIIVPLLAAVFLHENVSLVRWSGIIFIIAGIYFISKSGRVLVKE